MKTIDQLKAEQSAQLAKLEYELNVANAMPLTPDRVMQTALGEPWVTYKVKGIRPVIDLMRAFVVVPMVMLKDGCTYIKPLEQIKPEKHEKTTGTYAVSLTVNQGSGFGPDVKLYFFARVEAIGLIRVCINVDGPDYIGMYKALAADVSEQRDRNNRITARSYSANTRLYSLCDNLINWSSGDSGPIKTSANIQYFFCADVDGDSPGAEQSHTIGQLTNLCDMVEPENAAGTESEQ